MKEKGIYTKTEILQQPNLWFKTYELVSNQKEAIKKYLSEFLNSTTNEVIFTGAGSSFFIAEMIEGIFQKNTNTSTRAVQTTELVTHPTNYINLNKKILLVSIARSGNSPESVAAVKNSDILSDNIYNFIITCNAKGKLANMETKNKKHVFVLPDEANDKSLAMTSSVTSMTLVGILMSKINDINFYKQDLSLASQYILSFFDDYKQTIKKIADLDFQRAVFLGSGSLIGTAREAHLKLQELTDGIVIGKFDSFMGFRHGPKAVVNNKTLIVYLSSNNPYAQAYENDLINSVSEEQTPLQTVLISENKNKDVNVDTQIYFSESNKKISEDLLTICNIVPVQLLSFYKSLNSGLNPDSPSVSGAIHRVVQGVTIYDYKLEKEILVKS